MGRCRFCGDALMGAEADACRYNVDCLIDQLAAANERNKDWEVAATKWFASPEAKKQLDGYRELADKVNAAELALAAANERAGRLEEALDFYAKPDSWEYGNGAIFAIVESPAFVDAGEVARKALEVQ